MAGAEVGGEFIGARLETWLAGEMGLGGDEDCNWSRVDPGEGLIWVDVGSWGFEISLTALEKKEAAEGEDARFVLDELLESCGEKDLRSPVQLTDIERRCDGREDGLCGATSSVVRAEKVRSLTRSEVGRSRSKSKSREAAEARRERRSAGPRRGRAEVVEVGGAFELGEDVGRLGKSEENMGEGVRGKSSWIMSKTLFCSEDCMFDFGLWVAEWVGLCGMWEWDVAVGTAAASSVDERERGGGVLGLERGCGGR